MGPTMPKSPLALSKLDAPQTQVSEGEARMTSSFYKVDPVHVPRS